MCFSATTESEEKQTLQYDAEEKHAPAEEPKSAPAEPETPAVVPVPVPDATEFKVEPKDECELWKAKVKAEVELADALQKNVEFESGSTELPEEGKDVLNEVGKVLKDYPWMSIEVQGNSPAEGEYGQTLVTGRAKAAAEYLTSIGVTNSLSETGVQSDFIGLKIFPSGSTARPATCAEDGDRPRPLRPARAHSSRVPRRRPAASSAFTLHFTDGCVFQRRRRAKKSRLCSTRKTKSTRPKIIPLRSRIEHCRLRGFCEGSFID